MRIPFLIFLLVCLARLAPAQKASLSVLEPPFAPHAPYYKNVQDTLLHNPVVASAVFSLPWSAVDNGSNYDFTNFDKEFAPWIAAGKKVNLVVWAIGFGKDGTTTPEYMWKALGAENTTTCDGVKVVNFFNHTFQTSYQNFIQAVVEHYQNNSNIGYIRFGLGRGGETNPPLGTDGSDRVCTAAFKKWGFSADTWTNYLNMMIAFEGSLNSHKRLGVTLTGELTRAVSEDVAAKAVPLGIMIGSQGLGVHDVTHYPNCASDWCNMFNEYYGQVPLELQTVGPSCPSGSGCTGLAVYTGPLPPLLALAVSHHATNLEIYVEDWLIAFDPSNSKHAKYGATYAAALKKAAGQ